MLGLTQAFNIIIFCTGTGKSQFLKFAAKLSNRSVITTGLGSTSAGLTVTAVKDGGEWMLETGALFLADGGLCCIYEFDSMREHDRATIYEAMEQKTISVAMVEHFCHIRYHNLSLNSRGSLFWKVESCEICEVYGGCHCLLGRMKWKKAVEEELSALENNKTWVIVNLPKDKKPIGCQWVFTVKYKAGGSVELYKAGLVTALSTRTIVFGATNPKGHYDSDQPLSVNTSLSGPLLSRFDIVLVLLDTKNPEWDAVVSSHILGEGEYKNAKLDEDLANIWPLSILWWYIGYAKKHFKPVLTKEAKKVISSYYQLQRRSATHNAARTTVRMLESLIRLAKAHARLMFRNEVTRLDAIAAILCIESSMTISSIIDSIGNALHSNFTENPDQEYAKQEKVILEKFSLVDESQESNGLGGFC
ncbi:probable DNA helicase MCM9 [Hibiscus syriacus]|uniref:probable DNA helicase MCM9 n=1 Tax=Hibiscus syriacus TaxID=106335 RepID=UPI001923206B|nr:probable DNA helicase MCM9 [Hibiscus syriacus]